MQMTDDNTIRGFYNMNWAAISYLDTRAMDAIETCGLSPGYNCAGQNDRIATAG